MGAKIGVIATQDKAVPEEPSSESPSEVSTPQPAEAMAVSRSAATMPEASEDLLPLERRKRILASPRARHLAQQEGISLEGLTGTGPKQMITERDVQAYLEKQAAAPATKADRGVTLSPTRRTIARHMSESHQTTAPVTLIREVDATELVNLREQVVQELPDEDLRPTYTDFLISIVARSLKRHPLLNASTDGEALTLHEQVHVALAVDTDRGLLVPVIRDADRKELLELARERADLVQRAADGIVTPEELTGATFTITNLGGLLAFRGYNIAETFTDLVPFPMGMNAALMVGLFAFGLMLSTVLRAPMAAVGVAIMAADGCMLGYFYAVYRYLPARWGPWLGLFWPDMPVSTHIKVALVLSVLAIIAAACGFVRAPVLEGERRLRQTAGAFFGVVGAVVAVSLVAVFIWGMPSLSEVKGITVDPSGHWITLDPGRPSDREAGVSAVWVMDVEGERKRLLARGPVGSLGWSPTGKQIMFRWGENTKEGWNWLADPASGHLLPLPGDSEVSHWDWSSDRWWSPRGTYLFYVRENSLVLTDGKREVLEIGAKVRTFTLDAVIGWSPDEKSLYLRQPIYYAAHEPVKVAETLLIEVKIPSGERRTVATVEKEFVFGYVSPDGRWIAGVKPSPPVDDGPKLRATVLVEIATSAIHSFANLVPRYYGWSADGRYLWCRTSFESPGELVLRVLDTDKLAVVRSIGPKDLHGQSPLGGHLSPRGDKCYLRGHYLKDKSPTKSRYAWVAQPDGTGLKYLGKLEGSMVGWTYDGDLLIWKRETDGSIVRLNPDTGAERVIYPGPSR